MTNEFEPVNPRNHIRDLIGGVLEQADADRVAATKDAVAHFFVSLKLAETVGDRFPFAEADSLLEVEDLVARRWSAILRERSTLDKDGQLVEELLGAAAFVLGPTRLTAAKAGIAQAISRPVRPPLGRQALTDAQLEKAFGSHAVADLIAEIKQ